MRTLRFAGHARLGLFATLQVSAIRNFQNLEQPLALKGDPFHAGADNKVMYWAEFLMPEHAKALAYYDHPFFGRWPAITENQYGSGSLLYEGTYLSNGAPARNSERCTKKCGTIYGV